ncbi:hypothetical protein, partial [Acidovorax sp.]|uniref:hypothetical protein n=1 Tax=Acidovorax sp. TaxID=1872122 RepID=UPI0025C11643
NLANHVHGDHLLLPTAAKSSRVGKTPGSVLDRHHTKKWLSFRSASTIVAIDQGIQWGSHETRSTRFACFSA